MYGMLGTSILGICWHTFLERKQSLQKSFWIYLHIYIWSFLKKTYNIFLVSICMYIVHLLYTYIYILLQRVVLFFATYRIDMMTSNDIASENQNFHIIHRNVYYMYTKFYNILYVQLFNSNMILLKRK